MGWGVYIGSLFWGGCLEGKFYIGFEGRLFGKEVLGWGDLEYGVEVGFWVGIIFWFLGGFEMGFVYKVWGLSRGFFWLGSRVV